VGTRVDRTGVDAKRLLDMYRRMLLIRDFETRAAEEFARGNINGHIHTYAGEEAVAVGVCANLRGDDLITSTHRGHGHCIAKGGEVKYMMAELFGRRTGYCKGKGGSLHIADISLGILGANGIVGAGIPIALGGGLSAQLKGTDSVCISFFGDGASNQGTFHESLNLASIWKLPVIFIAENNQYAQTTPQKYHMNVKSISERATAYGIPGVVVDGNDVMAVYETAREAVRRARAGAGPTLVECMTYRQRGHYEGENMGYRTQAEVDDWKRRDPIPRFRQQLVKMGVASEAEAKQIEDSCQRDIEDAIRFANESPYPSPEETLEDVYVSYP
jgi:TPP-dependent pyruvate/acetoin dehydrogenase alpha subunit